MIANQQDNRTADDAAETDRRALRWSVYWLLITVSAGSMIGRILAVDSVDVLALERHLYNQGREDWQHARPLLSANDRSRWATVRALVEQNTYAIDDVVSQPGWDTIDMVQHLGSDGRKHLYSSKPPLLATVMAGEYWLINRLTGMTLETHLYEISRAMLITFNVIPLVIYFVLLAKLAERYGQTDWGRLFMLAAGALGTFLTTFAVSINNHLIAAVCAAASLYALSKIWHDGERRLRWFAICGFFAACTFANELPALAFFALVSLALLWKAPRQALIAAAPCALLVVAAFYGTNYLAHGTLREAYSHRGNVPQEDNWYEFTYWHNGRERQSYWTDPQGIDRGEPSAGWYAVHALVGHHGIFSLTPVWLLSVAGWGIWIRNPRMRPLAGFVGVLTLVCLAFYLSRPQIDRNYGGMACGLRWMFWFAPLWLVMLLPAADRLARGRTGRAFALVLLGMSVLSASYPTWNPWTSPWIQNWMDWMGWQTLG